MYIERKIYFKKESIIIQSIAVMLMVFHHLFGYPERINSDYIIISKMKYAKYLFSIILSIFLIIVRTALPSDCTYDYLFVPVLIFNVCISLKNDVLKKQ